MTADTRSNMLKSVAVSNPELASNNNNNNDDNNNRPGQNTVTQNKSKSKPDSSRRVVIHSIFFHPFARRMTFDMCSELARTKTDRERLGVGTRRVCSFLTQSLLLQLCDCNGHHPSINAREVFP